jgi:perosamine synthetase
MTDRTKAVPFAVPDVGEAELKEIKEVLESGWITTGVKVQRFERQFGAYVGAAHAVAVNSCTAAMHLALDAVGVRRGDIVLTTPYTFAATAEVISYFDAVPVFVDVERETLNMDPARLVETIDDLEGVLHGGLPPATAAVARALATRPGRRRAPVSSARRRRPATRAVIPVHIAGHPCEMDVISSIAAERGLAIVEDAAHACSAGVNGARIGSAPAKADRWAACFSFYATKTLTTGEGGMITTNSPEWADRCRVMSLHGITKDAWRRYTAEGDWYYEITAPGFKYNMPDIAAAIGLAQLEKLDRMRERRDEIARCYTRAFADEPAVEVPSVRPGVCHAWHLYMLRLNLDSLQIGRDEFINELKRRNIGCSVHFIPLHLHPYYRKIYGFTEADFPVAYEEYGREISLPIYSKMSDADVGRVIDAVTSIAREYGRKRVYAVAGR